MSDAYTKSTLQTSGLATSPVVQSLPKSTEGEGLTRAQASAGTGSMTSVTDHSLPDPDHALPSSSLVAETADLHSAGVSGLGGGGSAEIARATIEAKHDTAPVSATFGAAITPGAITPGQELPGGWGSTKVVTPETTIYQDAEAALHTIGQQAFSVLPASLVEKFSSHSISEHPVTTTTNSLPHEQTATSSITSGLPSIADVKAKASELYESLPSARSVTAPVVDKLPSSADVNAKASEIYESTPSAKDVSSSVQSTLPSRADVNAKASGIYEATPSAREVTAPVTSSLPSIADVKAKAANLYNSVPPANNIIPTASKPTTPNEALATSDIPTFQEVKDVINEEAHYAAGVASDLLGQAKAFLGYGTAGVHETSGSHEIAPALNQKGGETSLAGIGTEVAEAARESPATSAPIASSASASTAAPGFSSTEASPLAGAGGLAATIAPSVARAAEESPATSATGTGPVGGLDGDDKTKDIGSVAALAGAGGLAATIADDVAEAATTSTATSVGADIGTTSSRVGATSDTFNSGSYTFGAPKDIQETETAKTTGLAGAGGLAATIAPAVAQAAGDSSATSVGRTPLHSGASLTSPSSTIPSAVSSSEPLSGYNLGAPLNTSETTGFTTHTRETAPGVASVPVSNTDAFASKDDSFKSHSDQTPSAAAVMSPSKDSASSAFANNTDDSTTKGDSFKYSDPTASAAAMSSPHRDSASFASEPSTTVPVTDSANTLMSSKGEATNVHAAETPSAAAVLSTPASDVLSSPKATTTAAAAPASLATTTSASTPAKGEPLNKTTSSVSSPSSSSGHSHKASFGDKLKGSIKVMSGKMSHDEKKIAEGEKLKAGEL